MNSRFGVISPTYYPGFNQSVKDPDARLKSMPRAPEVGDLYEAVMEGTVERHLMVE